MNKIPIKYVCICSQKEFIRGNIYNIDVMTVIDPYTKLPKKLFIFANSEKAKLSFLLEKDNDCRMLCIENNIVVLVTQDLWRERQINKILNYE